jgi:hypothetical protein
MADTYSRVMLKNVWCCALLSVAALIGSESWAGASYEKASIVQVIKQASTMLPLPTKTGTVMIPAFPNYQVTIRAGDKLYLTACAEIECGRLLPGEPVDIRRSDQDQRKDQEIIIKRSKGKKLRVYLLTSIAAGK